MKFSYTGYEQDRESLSIPYICCRDTEFKQSIKWTNWFYKHIMIGGSDMEWEVYLLKEKLYTWAIEDKGWWPLGLRINFPHEDDKHASSMDIRVHAVNCSHTKLRHQSGKSPVSNCCHPEGAHHWMSSFFLEGSSELHVCAATLLQGVSHLR